MSVLSFIFGLIAVLFMFIGFIPLLGWLNWLNIPFAILGLVFGAISVSTAKRSRGLAIAGIVLCILAIVFGALKLQTCGGFV